jgi:RND family efflux transporter MFP subunit
MERLSALFELATAYHGCRDADALLKIFAAQVGSRVGARAVLVWVAQNGQGELSCKARWAEPGERFDPANESVTEGLLAELLEGAATRRLDRDEIEADQLTHLAETHRERVKSALFTPLPGARGATGVVEVLNKRSGSFTADDAAFVEEASRITGPALENLQTLDQERHQGLVTIERLTALYDISRVFNSTLELEELLPVVAEKIGDILRAQVTNLWLVDSEASELYFAQQVGDDPTTREDDRVPIGEGLLGEAAQTGKARLVPRASEEPLLAQRQKGSEQFRIETLMCAPLMKGEEVLGVVEVVNKEDGTAFDEEDLFFLTTITEQAAIALHNANLLVAERKVHELDALLAISKEITSTLDLDHVLTTVVNQAATVLPFDRCAIGLFDRNRFILGGLSGEAEVPKTREMDRLREILAWVAEQPEAVSADRYEDGWTFDPESIEPQLKAYLEEFGYNGFYAVPLRDEQGTLGVLALLSGDAEFLNESQLETLSILSSQITVAIRNARLYQQVPLVSLLKPFAEKKQKLESLAYGRWLEMGWKAGLVALLLVLVPWKMRVETNARVVPAERRVASAEVGGVINKVFVHEGDKVTAGELLAQMNDSESRVKLAEAQANLGLARRDLADAESRGDLGAAATARLHAQMHQTAANLYQEKVEKAQLRAPLAGVIVTPKVEEFTGKMLAPGDRFCEVMEPDEMAAEMNVAETDIALVRPGGSVALKLNAFPAHTYEGRVERVATKTIAAEGEQFFVARALFVNPPDRHARDGMVGRAKISARGGWFESGWYPVGFVLLRAPARWAWEKLWSWVP